MLFYNNIKAMARTPNGDTNFFDIVAEVLKGIYEHHICLYSEKTAYLERHLI